MFKKILFLSSLVCVFVSGVAHAQVLPSTLIVSNVLYNAGGQMTQINYGNGNLTTYTYNNMQRLTKLKTVNSTNQTIQDLNYTYDAVGDILSITDNVNTADQTFQYDHLNRLTQAVGQLYGTKNYSYNTIGNITSKDGLTYTYDGIAGGPHAVTSLSDGTTFTYDDNGNMLTMQKGADLTEYSYDTENHLTQVKENSVVVESYTYDGDGGRTKKLPNGATPATKFVGQMYDEQGMRETSSVFLGDQRIASITNGAILYLHGDHLGSANLVTSSTGTLKELSEYEPYGKFSKHEKYGSADEEAWYYFTNQYLDEATDLYYYGARYYSPLIGRFITADTIVQSPSNPQTFNRYSYCGNNPINYVDPSGHIFGLVIAFAIKAIMAAATYVAAHAAAIGIGAAVGGALGGVSAAITGGNVWQGIITGAIGGAVFGGLSPGLSVLGRGAGGIGPMTQGWSIASKFTPFLAGAAAGAATAAYNGTNIGKGALSGGLFSSLASGVGTPNFKPFGNGKIGSSLNRVANSSITGAAVGGAYAGATGKNIVEGLKAGAMGWAAGEVANISVGHALGFIASGGKAPEFKDGSFFYDAFPDAGWITFGNVVTGPINTIDNVLVVDGKYDTLNRTYRDHELGHMPQSTVLGPGYISGHAASMAIGGVIGLFTGAGAIDGSHRYGMLERYWHDVPSY